MTTTPKVYPFTAIVGQEAMKQALLLNVVSPAIGGVLIRGEKGTAKSTAARALAALLPDRAVVAGCRFACDPDDPVRLCPECLARLEAGQTLPRELAPARLVDLPVGATEDRVVGSGPGNGHPRRPASFPSSPESWPGPTAPFSMPTRSTSSTTTSWTCSWTRRPWASTPWNARACRFPIRPGSCWSAP